VWGLIGLGALGLDIPVLRQIVAFIFLTFIPGILLLRILKIHNAGIIESLLYSVGLSLAFVMVTGVVANFALPPLGISHPITLAPLTATFTVLFLILCLLAYTRDKNFRPANPPTEANEKPVKAASWSKLNPYLLAILLPLLAILGAILVNSYQNNTLLLALIIIIVLIIGLVAFNKFIPPRVYPFMIVMMALALIYQTTLISSNLVGSDIYLEYYLGNLVVENGYWDASIPFSITSCLSIVMLAPVYSLLLNMDIVWLFKIVYPLLFCLAPLALFRIFHLQIKPLYAFLAAFFFISMPMFMMDMAQLCRQQISELFFVLVILLMVDRKLTLIQRTTLVLIFGFGVVVSHYGMGTGYIGYLIFGALVLLIIKSRPGRTLWQWLIGKSNSLPADLTSAGAFNKKALAIIVGVSLVFMLGYYSVVTSGVALGGSQVAVLIAKGTTEQIVQGITTPPAETPPAETPPAETPPAETPAMVELPGFIQNITTRFPMLNPLFKEPLTQTALGLDFPLASSGGKVWRIFQYLVELCLIVGFFRLIFRPGKLGKFKAEYISLIMVSFFILLGVFVLPTSGYGMGGVRIFGITLLLMAPLFLFGGEAIGHGVMKLGRLFRRGLASPRLSLENPVFLQSLVLVVLIPYFIFNSGVVFELSRSQTTHFINIPYSIALSSHRVEITDCPTRQDIASKDWLSTVAGADYLIYLDHHSRLIGTTIELFDQIQDLRLGQGAKQISSPSYIYLRTRNTQKKALTFGTSYAARQSISFDDLPWFVQAMEKSDRIYNNGGAEILLHRRNGATAK
ncbi:MAG: DUF2206 domain-containing protein, partial [Chloroflexi bacterium]|nr:DUF2206 domain-containing protein [Chloroflexota bacterium]